MILQPKIKSIQEKKLIGKRLQMSLANNKTFQLWRSFMPLKNQILNNVNTDMISMQVYSQAMRLGDLDQVFEKWAAVEVSDFENVPEGMESFILEGGEYAVFDYKGLNTDPQIFIDIFGTWLPNSNYEIADRPHFEVLGEKYKNGDPNSEEEIWIPIVAR